MKNIRALVLAGMAALTLQTAPVFAESKQTSRDQLMSIARDCAAEIKSASRFINALSLNERYADKVVKAVEAEDKEQLIKLIAQTSRVPPKQIVILGLKSNFFFQWKIGRWEIFCYESHDHPPKCGADAL